MTIHEAGILSLDSGVEALRSMDSSCITIEFLRSVNSIVYKVPKQRPDTMSRDSAHKDGCPGFFMWFWQEPYTGKEYHICLKPERVEALSSGLT